MSLYWAEAEAKYEATLKASRVLRAAKGVEVTKELYVEVFSLGVVEVDPSITTLADEGKNAVIRDTVHETIPNARLELSSFFLLHLVRKRFL